MAAHSPTYKLQRKLSVDKDFDELKPPFHMFKQPSDEPHFYTEQRIQIKPFLTRLNLRASKDQNEPGYGREKQDLISILDEQSRLDHSGSDRLSQTLINLGMRKGHSFEKQKIDFSISSEALDTEHENLYLRKKITEMKKELAFYRQHDQSMFQEKLKYIGKNQKAQNEINSLKQELDNAKKRIVELEDEQISHTQRIEQLQRVIAMTPKKRKTIRATESDLESQIENYKSALNKHEQQIQKIKQYYEKQLFENSSKFRKLIDQINQDFENAKIIGQKQINELVEQLMEKDEEIIKLRKKLTSGQAVPNRDRTLISDHVVEKSNNMEHPPLDKRSNKYMNRFIQFSQFIDQKIHKSLSKDKLPPRQRISKSVIDKEPMVPKHLKQLKISISESPESPEKNLVNKFKISELLQRNQRLRTPTNFTYQRQF